MRGKGLLFRYTTLDALPALSVVGLVALDVACCLYFRQMPLAVVIPCFALSALGYCWNLQCLSHNFIHNPFFRWSGLNRVFSVLETLALGVPQVFYHHYHLNHHSGDNDRKGADGLTRDWSSTYRHGRGDQVESFWSYVLLSFWRVEVGPLVGVVIRHGTAEIAQAVVECLVLVAFWGALAWFDWRHFLLFYLPSYYLGWMLSYAQGYLEHYDTRPGDPFANSVSSYNRLYNLLWFNNGYHQEHHWDPKRHWTRMPGLHDEIRPELAEHGTRILKGPHLTALFEEWLIGPYRLPKESKEAERRAAA